eukprot:576060-Prymnesium_polylepis.1
MPPPGSAPLPGPRLPHSLQRLSPMSRAAARHVASARCLDRAGMDPCARRPGVLARAARRATASLLHLVESREKPCSAPSARRPRRSRRRRDRGACRSRPCA